MPSQECDDPFIERVIFIAGHHVTGARHVQNFEGRQRLAKFGYAGV
jgi:hypothetical protein